MTAMVSPCINVCRMEGNICVGCLRTLDEIAGWSQFPDSEKRSVLARLEQRKAAAGMIDFQPGE
ncbi:MAG: DUF1289 domain-containing protein [Rugosibacter sp.]|nr:DUF1289 domain-containing protein [Rugosibacter sp.]